MPFAEDWPEFISVVALVVAFLVAVFSGSAFVSYTLVFLAGLTFGRVWYRRRRKEQVPLFLIIAGFLLGFLLGTLYGDVRVIVVLFLIGIALSYWLHQQKIVRSVEY